MEKSQKSNANIRRKPETEDCVVLNMIASPPEEALRDSQTILHLKMPRHRITHVAKLEKIKLFEIHTQNSF